jgi:hypothetical protein
MGAKLHLRVINIVLILFILLVASYIVYSRMNSKEGFDDGTIQKVTGVSTLLNGQEAYPKTASSINLDPASANIKVSDPVASETPIELPSAAFASPSEIAANAKVVNTIVPDTPPPMNFNLSPAARPPIEIGMGPSAYPPLNAKPVVKDPSDLSPKEKQLFDAFLEKRISDDKIQELIESGVLTGEIVEKFLKLIDDLPEGPPVTRAPNKGLSMNNGTKSLSTSFPINKSNENLLEGFCGNGYAVANSF